MQKVQRLLAITSILLDKRKSHKDTTFPVKLRVTYNRMQKYYPIRYAIKQTNQIPTKHQKYWLTRFEKTISFSDEEFQTVRDATCREPNRTMFNFLNEIEAIAISAISKIPSFTFTLFEETYFNKPVGEKNIISELESVKKELTMDGRVSTAISYNCTIESLKKFTTKEKISFEDLTVSFLKDYEKWMLSKKNSLTTVGIYLRNVRTVYNKAKKEGVVTPGLYPFGEGKYEIPTGKNIKKALKFEEIKKIAAYAAEVGSVEEMYRDYWLFSYLCNGINIKDIARLTYGNIEGELIKLTRAKTEREKRHSPRPITIIITKQISRIINQWGIKPEFKDQHIFPILKKEMTPEEEYKAIQQATKQINKYIKRIAKALEFTDKVTSYTARHSFATVLKRSGASVEFISESLGHSNTTTTENYLADFEIEEKRKWAEKAGDF